MGNYLNSKAPWEVFQREAKAPYFVDKSELLKEVLQQVEWEADISVLQDRVDLGNPWLLI